MMLTRHAGQELLDGLSALSLGASTLVVARWLSASALRSRLAFVFGGLCSFFTTRAAADALQSGAFEIADQMIACAMPLAALLLVEGVVRRHAPRPLKALVTFGALAVALALLLPAGRSTATTYGLGAFVVFSLLCVTALLVLRDRASLSGQENAAVDALAVPGVVLTVLTVTDFVPTAPVGLSDVGCAMLAFVLAANPRSRPQARGVLTELLLMTLVACVTDLALSAALALDTPDQTIRLGAILLALLLASAAVLRVRRARDEQTTQSFARALTAADTSSVESFLSGLVDQPLLAGLRLVEDAELADYDPDRLATALEAHSVWTRSRASEELADLMARTDATHAVMISRRPLRIALFVLPGGGAPDYAETDLALFGKLAAVAATERRASHVG